MHRNNLNNNEQKWVHVDDPSDFVNHDEERQAREVTEKISRNIREEQKDERYRQSEEESGRH